MLPHHHLSCRSNRTGSLLLLAAGYTLALVAGGCRQTPPVQQAPLSPPRAFTPSGSAALPEQWWRSFADPELDRLLAGALTDNFDLRTAWERLRQAEAVARLAGADRSLALNLTAGAERRAGRTDGDRFRIKDYSLGVSANYELDIWGRITNAVEAAQLDLEATAEEVKAAAITLSAQVAGAWYGLAEAEEQIRVLTEQTRVNGDILTLVTARFSRGKVQAADVLRQRQLLEGTQGSLTQARSRRQVLRHALAVLLGRSPGSTPWTANPTLVELGPLPAAGVPARLIRHRPDLRAAFLAVRAAEHRVAAAIADRFPRISLTASASTGAERIKDLFDNWLTGLAANLLQPLLDGGARRAEVERKQALAAQALNQYGQVVLEALQEVENALVQEKRQTEYLASLRRQLATSRQVVERTRDSYLNGQVDYLRVLETLTSTQSLERTLVTARRQLIDHRISLCRALATGWSLPQRGAHEDDRPGSTTGKETSR